MAHLEISLFGTFQAVIDGQPVESFRTRKVQALLAYLAVEGASGSGWKEKLMLLLWPGLPQKSAQVNLRQIIYQLRKAIPPVETQDGGPPIEFLLSDRQSVRINPAYPFQVDVSIFDALLRKSRDHDHLDLVTCPECQAWLEQAVGLYRGNFLEDFYIEDSNEFEEWADAARENLRRRALDAMESLAEIQLRQNNYPEARNYAERQLQIDNLRESAYRQLMLVLAISGQRSEAMGVYESCRRLLAESLGMAPSGRTTTLYEQILAGDLNAGETSARNVRGYEIKEKIGSGAFGTVHRAFQTSIGREVAIKVIRAEYANDPAFIRRFEAEAQTIARLEHPHIVPLYDYWREPDRAFLSMRLFRNGSLQSALKSGPWPLEKVTKLLGQIALALEAAHDRGIIHRDLKPANILLDEADNAYLSDFGIAFDQADPDQRAVRSASPVSPDYASPEQLLYERLTPQSDIYCLGLVLFEALTGEKPFGLVSPSGQAKRRMETRIPLLSSRMPGLPVSLDVVLQRATEKEPGDRYSSVMALAVDFNAAIRAQTGAGEIPAITTGRDQAGKNPFKGLRPFKEEDAGEFFGRRELVDRFITKLSESRFLAVVGPSGSGKSSGVSAGLIPALRSGAIRGSEKWFIARMAPGAHPLEELEQALLPIAVNPPPSLVEPVLKDRDGLARTLRRILPEEEEGSQLLLVIDQFEELYTLTTDEQQRDHFIERLLAAIADPGGPLRLVITLRADFFDRPLEDLQLGELLRSHTELVLQLSSEELESAVRGPATRAGVQLEAGLMTAIAADFNDQPGALPLLQYALTELYEARQGQTLTREAYQSIGGIAGALGRRAEDLYVGLDERDQAGARQVFLRLVSVGEGGENTRRRTLLAELQALGEEVLPINPEDGLAPADLQGWAGRVEPFLELFGRHRLLTFDRDPITRGPTVEVAHEALLDEWPRLRGWLDDNRADIRLERQLAGFAAEWSAAGRNPGYLLRDSRLEQFEIWVKNARIVLTGEERAFLDASLAARSARQAAEAGRLEHERALEKRSRNFLRSLVGVFAAATVIAVFLSVFAYNQQGIAQTEARSRGTQQAIAEMQADSAATSAADALAQKGLAEVQADARATQQTIAEEQRVLAEDQADARATQQAIAEGQASLAFSRELAASALVNLSVDPELSILLALHALEVTRTLQAENILHQAVQASRLQLTILDNILGDGATIGYSPDGTRLVAAGEDGLVRVWDAATGQELLTLTGHTAWVLRAFFSPDGQYIATSSEDNTTRVWDAMTGRELLVLEGHSDVVLGLAFSPDSSRVATASYDLTARVWDLTTGEEILVFSGHTGELFDIAYSPDGALLATGGLDNTRVWSAVSGQEVLILNVQAQDLEFSPDSTHLATRDPAGNVVLWDLTEPGSENYGQKVLALPGALTQVATSIAYSPDGMRLVMLGNDRSIIVWDTVTGLELDRIACHPGGSELALSTITNQLAVAGNGVIKICDLAPGRELLTLTGFTDRVYDASFSPDGFRLYTASRSGGMKLWDISAPDTGNFGNLIYHLEAQDDRFFDSVPSPDGAYLAISSALGTPTIWDTRTWDKLFSLNGHMETVWDIAFSPDGTRLVSGGFDTSAKVWDAVTGQELLTLTGHTSQIDNVVFSHDGLYVVTASYDGLAKIWDALTGKELSSIEIGTGVWGPAFSPDGSLLSTAGNEGLVHLWDFSTLIATGVPTELLQLTGHNGLIVASDFSPDGTLLATAGADLTIKVWDVASGQLLLTLSGHRDLIWDVEFSPDGKWLASASWDRTARLYLVDLDDLIALALTRVTRWWTTEECRLYLHQETCPAAP
jgi:WD40 repeat protein/serine/threonine protein kinase/two-component SAPR family response regulator